jgi:ParB family chromosome partitioning protein
MAKPKPRLGRGLSGLIAGGKPSSAPVQSLDPKSVSKAAAKPPAKKGVSAKPSSKPRPIEPTPAPAEGLMEIPLAKIRPNPRQPRREMEAEKLKELAESIRAEGLLQPIVVRPVGDHFEIIAGERRFRAYQSLERSRIPARIMAVSDASSAALALIENLQREGLNPIEEALGYASLMRDFDLTQEETAERVGKNRASLANALRLLQLSKTIQGFLTKGLLSVGHAKVLLGIEDANQREALARSAIEKGWSVRQTETEVQKLGKVSKGNRPRPTAENIASWMAPLERQLTSELQARVSLKQRGKKTQMTIEVHGREELDRILGRLNLNL